MEGSGQCSRKSNRQIWGELHYFDCAWGFATNGSRLFLYVKSAPNELTVGPLTDWMDPTLLQTLCGLCFASIDEELRGHDLIEYLCEGAGVNW